MGWKWEEEDDVASSDWVPRDSTEDRCSTRRFVKSSCRTEEVEPGRFVRKCDKTEQILRDCVGRPTEIVESKSEHTEDDVTNEVTSGKHRGLEPSPGLEPFGFPGLQSDIERGISGGLGHFFEAAEQMAEDVMKGFFHSFTTGPTHPRRESSSPFGRWMPADGRNETKSSEQTGEASAYDGLPGEITDV